MRIALRSLSLAFIVLAALFATGGPIRLDFRIDPAQSLPAIPVTFRVRAVNTGSVPATLKPVWLQLQRREGDQWVVISFDNWEHHGGGVALPSEPIETEEEFHPVPGTTLAPGEEHVFDYVAGRGSPPWFGHPDLLKPGTFELRLVTWSDDPDVEEITSNTAMLTIQTPAGQDAGAWNLIKGSSHIMLERGRFADQLWSLYPDSVYTSITPRNVPRRDSWEAYLNAYTEILTKNPPPAFADLFRHEIATAHLYLMDEAVRRYDVQQAFQHSEAARTILQQLANKELEFELKRECAKLLQSRVASLSQIERHVYELRYGAAMPVCERAQAKEVRSALSDLIAASSEKLRKTLTDVVADLDKFDSVTVKTPVDMDAALASLEQAASRLEAAVKNEGLGPNGIKALSSLCDIAQRAATKAIEASANQAGAKQSDLTVARQKFDDGRASLAAGDYKKAISRFREALHKAEGASTARASFC